MNTYFSHGKLLLTSEYAVLDGALALAVPTKWGQELFIEEIPDSQGLVIWRALHQNSRWLETKFSYLTGEIISADIPEAATFVREVINQVRELSEIRLRGSSSYKITTNLQFPSDFGLGSSSTLMNNLAQWAEVDPFVLNSRCLGGSGYDIAVAQHNSAILYQTKPARVIRKINYHPPFAGNLLLIHLNRKQNSREGISLYHTRDRTPNLITEFSALTEQIVKSSTLEDFSALMTEHEQKLSDFLGLETVKDRLFSDCPVFVKSLGAWGGDFVLTAQFPGYEEYFREKGFTSVFSYTDLIQYQ